MSAAIGSTTDAGLIPKVGAALRATSPALGGSVHLFADKYRSFAKDLEKLVHASTAAFTFTRNIDCHTPQS